MIVAALLWMLAVALLLAGFIGLLLPALPGPPLIFAGLLMAAWLEEFRYVGPWTLALLALMAALSYLVDVLSGALGARGFGATRAAMVGALAGVFVGMFFGLPGMVLGPFLGAVIGELLAERSLREAGSAGLGATIGLALGLAAKLALAFAMVGIFVAMRLWGGLR